MWYSGDIYPRNWTIFTKLAVKKEKHEMYSLYYDSLFEPRNNLRTEW